MIKHTLVFILLFIFTLVRAQEQTFNFNNLTIKNGLSSGLVTCILQDRKGFIWIGTDNGLNKFDGFQVQIFKHNPSTVNTIGGNSIRCLFEDSKNNLWIGLKGDGLCRLNLRTGKFTTFRKTGNSNSLSYNDAAGIVEDHKGHLWIAVDRGGLDMFDPVNETFVHYYIHANKFKQTSNNAFTDISLDAQGNIWLSSWGEGIYCFNIKNKNFSRHSFWDLEDQDEKICKHIYDLFIDKENTIWVSSAHSGLYSLNESKKKYRQYIVSSIEKNSINSRDVRSVCDDDKGNLWIGTTEGGINILNKKTGHISVISSYGMDEKKMLSNSANCIYKDNNGIMWIGTSVGVNYYHPLSSQFTLIDKSTSKYISLSESQVMSLLKDKTGNIWVGSFNSLDKISADRKTIKRYKLDNLKYFDSFRYNQAICEDKTGNIWIGAYSEYLTMYNPIKDRFTRVNIPSNSGKILPYSNVFTIYEDRDNTLWLGTELGTLNYNPHTGIFTTLFHSGHIIYPEEKSHVVYRDSYLDFWVGTEAGLRRYTKDLKHFSIYKVNTYKKDGLTNNFITAILEEKNGNLWIGTMGGLHYFNRKAGTFKLIKQTDNFYGDPIFGICDDRAGNLWMSTTSGILKFNKVSHQFRLYDESDGLQNKDFQLGAYYQAKDGEILFGGKNGLNLFYPSGIKINKRKPTVLITDFQIFNQSIIPSDDGILTKSIGETKEITLKHSLSVITFKFVALSFISSQKNKYAYMMDGFDQNWIYAEPNQRSATYMNLEPGDYTFKVKASNNDGLWNEKGTEIKIRILPPFWKTGFAYTLYVLLFFSIIYLIIKYFTIRERDKNNLKIAKLEAQRIQEIDELKFNLFTNVSHEFRTPLSLILGPLAQIMEKGDFKKEDGNLFSLMSRNAQRLLRLINQLLDFRKIEVGKLELNLKYDDIIKFITDSANEFEYFAKDKNIRYSIKSSLQELKMNFDSDKIDKVLYNLISNAFHYTPEGGKIAVNIYKCEIAEIQYLQIQISDTGIGMSDEELGMLFTIFYQGKRQKNMRNGGSGIGLTLTKNLVELHNGKILVSSEVDKGSTFTIQFPINDSNITEYNTVETIADSSDFLIKTIETEENTSRVKEHPVDMLLIVEDNYDMRLYIQNILSEQFNVQVAKDGQEGLEMALKYIPDLIISDVMMPRMDGLEMVSLLRDNEKTNHIPIILLTSRQTESQIVEGFEIGVEDYISKPFSASVLIARIQNILTSRKKMWEQYKLSKDIDEYTEKLTDSPQKQHFVILISEIINKHIEEPEFSIETLANELHMSVNQLFRKVKALMDTTPYNVIVQIRMTQATLLMRESDKNISEISLSVGYQELSNFSRAFKKYFNVSPRDYMKDNR